MTPVKRAAVMVLLLVVGLTVGVLLKHGLARSESFETNGDVTQAGTGIVDHQRVASPTLAAEVNPSAGGAMLHEPRYAPRDPLEWQGMLVDLSMQPNCESSRQCGLAMACRGGKCGSCADDGECASGEGCVLDHCLAKSAIECRSRRDCVSGELCVLSGYSSDARGNGDMTARCLPAGGGTPQAVEALAPREDVPAEPTPVRADELMRSLTEEARP